MIKIIILRAGHKVFWLSWLSLSKCGYKITAYADTNNSENVSTDDTIVPSCFSESPAPEEEVETTLELEDATENQMVLGDDEYAKIIYSGFAEERNIVATEEIEFEAK